MLRRINLSEFTKLQHGDLLAAADMRTALLMLGSGDLFGPEYVPG